MTAQDLTSPDLAAPHSGPGTRHDTTLLDRLPENIRAGLTPEQAAAIGDCAAPAGRHPVDVRVTVPFPCRPVFLSVVAGRERRSPRRRAVERRRHPLHTAGNLVFLGPGLVGIYVLGLIAFLAAGSVLQF